MPETIPISPGLISTRASEASAETIRTGAGERSARPREGRLRRSGAAISSEPYTGEEVEGKGGGRGEAACESAIFFFFFEGTSQRSGRVERMRTERVWSWAF